MKSFFVLAIELASLYLYHEPVRHTGYRHPALAYPPLAHADAIRAIRRRDRYRPRLDVYSVVPVLRAQLDIVAPRDLRQIDPFILLSVYRDHRNCPAARAHRKAVRNQPCYHHGCQNDYPFFRFSVHKHIVVYAAAVVNRQSNVLYCDIIGIGMSI